MLSITEGFLKKSVLFSRRSPSKKCSDSIVVLPNLLASYRAKNITRRALSVYRSNIGDAQRHSILLRMEFPILQTKLRELRTWTGQSTLTHLLSGDPCHG